MTVGRFARTGLAGHLKREIVRVVLTTTLATTLAATFAIVPWLGVPAVQAATFTVTPPLTSSSKTAPPQAQTIRMTGAFEAGDAKKLRDILERLPAANLAKADAPLTIVELSSLGGSLSEGLEVGAVLRKFKVIAVVRKRDVCLSACALAFLGGNAHHEPLALAKECNIEPGGKVGFHNFWLNRTGLRASTSEDPVASRLEGFNDARGGAALLIKYAGEMGLAPNFIANMMGRPIEDFQYIESVEQFLALHVCLLSLERPAISPSAQAGNVCKNSIGSFDPAAPLEQRLIPAPQAKQYLLERVQQNMQAVKTKGRLADQLASYAVMRVQQEIDRLYDDLRAAGVALPDIVGPTFEIGRMRNGVFEIACYVSLSLEDPDNFDVVVQGAKGLSQPLKTPPDNSRRLFLYDPRDVINARI
ncbi:hypothetical protein BH11PSE3_BH11PSE3_24150 [soil metagenome]